MTPFLDVQVKYYFFPSFNKWYLKFDIVADLKKKQNSAEERMM